MQRPHVLLVGCVRVCRTVMAESGNVGKRAVRRVLRGERAATKASNPLESGRMRQARERTNERALERTSLYESCWGSQPRTSLGTHTDSSWLRSSGLRGILTVKVCSKHCQALAT
ncbi:hypothetical protein C8T65DRAFT_651303 [Cerioporus squamosus]|nr:hypothetical protein C8T65DRAFT_651303 [Cerioporus squamosus]